MSQQIQQRPDADFGGWLLRTAKQNPEALLVLAAGSALLMRGSRGMAAGRRDKSDNEPPRGLTHGLSEVAGSVREGAAGLKNRAADVVSTYVSSTSDYLQDTGQTIAIQARRGAGRAQGALEEGFGEILRQQPLAIAAAGVAAGAFVAALFPRLTFEEETLRTARDVVSTAAAAAKDSLVNAAVETGQHLKESAAERGMSVEGLKEMTLDAVDTFKSKIVPAPDQAETDLGTSSDAIDRGMRTQ